MTLHVTGSTTRRNVSTVVARPSLDQGGLSGKRDGRSTMEAGYVVGAEVCDAVGRVVSQAERMGV